MPLTWQDVAGRVQAPDMTRTSELITRGIAALGESVADVVGGPEQRRQAQLAREILGLKGQQEASAQVADGIRGLRTDMKNVQNEKDMKEFGAAQSVLEATAADFALQGKSYDEFLKSDVYAKLGEGARAYGASHMSDAFYRGQQTRDRRLEQEQNNRVQEAQLAMQRENLALSRQARADAAESRRIAERTAQLRLDALERDEKDRKFANTELGRVTQRVGANFIDATGRAYEDKPWEQLAKGAGVEDWSEYRESLNALNERRKGKKDPITGYTLRPLPEGTAKMLLATQQGKNSGVFLGFPAFANEIDQGDIDKQMSILADQFDATLREADVLTKFKTKEEKGIPFTDDDVLKELARMNPANQEKAAVASGPVNLMDTWQMAHK